MFNKKLAAAMLGAMAGLCVFTGTASATPITESITGVLNPTGNSSSQYTSIFGAANLGGDAFQLSFSYDPSDMSDYSSSTLEFLTVDEPGISMTMSLTINGYTYTAENGSGANVQLQASGNDTSLGVIFSSQGSPIQISVGSTTPFADGEITSQGGLNSLLQNAFIVQMVPGTGQTLTSSEDLSVVTPEPGTLALAGLALSAVGLVRFRRRKP